MRRRRGVARRRSRLRRLGAALALVALPAGLAGRAEAREFQLGGISGSLDTTLSIGAAVRVEDRDCHLIYTGHGGCNDDPFAINADDGDLNYDRWDFYSVAFKATSELEIRWENLGAFLRATSFYDAIQNDHDPQRTDLDRDARYRSSPINSGVVGLGFLLLDAYVWGSFEPRGRALDLRLGNQVVSWGESLFTPGGIAQTNAVDITRIRVPGFQLKEAFVPAPMLWASLEPFPNVGIEAYYQFYWNRIQLDPTGSYFASSDLVGRAAQGLFLPQLTAGNPDPTKPADPGATNNFVVVPRRKDDTPSSQGQGGVALRYFAESILTEFGVYYTRYHAKAPGVGFQAQFSPGLCVNFGCLTGYLKEYPEDVDSYGVSVSTELFNVAFGAEVSFRPHDPVPIEANGVAVLRAFEPLGPTDFEGPPAEASGFVTESRVQALLNAIWSVGPGTRLLGPLVTLLGADEITVISEVGLVLYDLDHKDDFRAINATLEDPPDDFPLQGQAFLPLSFQRGVRADYTAPGTSAGFGRERVHESSWGYQLLIQPTYTNPFGVPITVQPRLAFRHDVNGNTPGLNPFIDGRKGFTVGVNVDYLNTWVFDLSHTRFFGAGAANLVNDRDFIAASLSYSF